jgi:diamine N-acetyltransferase
MLYISPNNYTLLLRRLTLFDVEKLAAYWQQLSDATRSRFAPHLFDVQTLQAMYATGQDYRGYIAIDSNTDNIVAYAVLKLSFLEHDAPRLQGYGLSLNHAADATFAPSVADAWQGQGIGKHLLQLIKNDLQDTNVNRLILWGGVQASNERAVQYYHKQGFVLLGRFENHGWNEDMLLILDTRC